MIELFTADTPNGWKISIMLEEIKLDYKVTKINLCEGEQHEAVFKKISRLCVKKKTQNHMLFVA